MSGDVRSWTGFKHHFTPNHCDRILKDLQIRNCHRKVQPASPEPELVVQLCS